LTTKPVTVRFPSAELDAAEISMDKMKLFEQLAWRLQLDACRLALAMEHFGLDNLKLTLIGKEEWEVTLRRANDHADDERRDSNGR
jgi:hypothetical protein